MKSLRVCVQVSYYQEQKIVYTTEDAEESFL